MLSRPTTQCSSTSMPLPISEIERNHTMISTTTPIASAACRAVLSRDPYGTAAEVHLVSAMATAMAAHAAEGRRLRSGDYVDFVYGHGHGHPDLAAIARRVPIMRAAQLGWRLDRRWSAIVRDAARPVRAVPVPQTH